MSKINLLKPKLRLCVVRHGWPFSPWVGLTPRWVRMVDRS